MAQPFVWPRPVIYGETEDLPIARIRCGRGFAYRDHRGRLVKSPRARIRFDALAIPPAWEEVRIAARGNRHVQAIGRDSRKRKQYRYHPLWIEQNKLRDFGRLPAFAMALPTIREFIDTQLRRQILDRERMLGIALRLLEQTLIRVFDWALENTGRGDSKLDDAPRALALIPRPCAPSRDQSGAEDPSSPPGALPACPTAPFCP